MSPILRPFMLCAWAIRAFFRADLKLRRGDRGLEVVLDESPSPRGKSSKRSSDAGEEKAALELAAMRRSLARLLDENPRNRDAMRHLAFIEYALKKKGLPALHKVPYDALKRGLTQMETMVVNWSDVGLATLRSKMAVALIEREAEALKGAADDPAAASSEPAPDLPEATPLAHPVALEGDDAAEAEAALRAVYGDVALAGLELAPEPDAAPVSVHGELSSPSGQALARAARRPADVAG